MLPKIMNISDILLKNNNCLSARGFMHEKQLSVNGAFEKQALVKENCINNPTRDKKWKSEK